MFFYIFLCERRKGGRKDGRRKGGGAFGVGWLKMGKPRGAGANAGWRLVDEWFKGWLGGVCCMEWLGGGTMSVFGQCPIGASMALPYLSDR